MISDVYLVVYRSPVTGNVTGEVFERYEAAQMMAVATETTYRCKVAVFNTRVDVP